MTSKPVFHPYPAQKTQIIFVDGSERNRGQQHAEQLGSALNSGMAPFYFQFYQRLLNPSSQLGFEKIGYQFLSFAIEEIFSKRLQNQIPLELRSRIQGVSEVSGISEKAFLTTLVLPDLLPMLQAYWLKWKPDLAIDAAAPPRFGCSSFIAKGNKFLLGRNLDFPGVAYWDRFPVLEVVHPPSGYKYVGFTSAGVPLAGISGINEKGISIALHQHYCFETNLSGKLPFVAAEQLLNQAKNLNEALEILRKAELASSWAFIVADREARDGFIFESTPTQSGVRWLKDESNVLTHSNYFKSPDLQGRDYATTERMNWDNFWRCETLNQVVKKNLEELSVEKAVKWMSCHRDPFWDEEKIVNRTVSQVYNIQSYVIDLEDMKLFLAEGECPIHLRTYQEYDLAELFDKRKGANSRKIPGFQFEDRQVQRAKESYILSFVSAFDNQFEEALQGLEMSIQEHQTPEAYLVAALVSLRIGKNKTKALNYLEEGRNVIERKMREKNIDFFPPEYFEICLYQARVLSLLNRKTEASLLYKEITKNPSLRDTNIKKIASKEKPYSEKKLRLLVMPYSTYIPFE